MKRDSITIVLVSESKEPLTMEFSIKEMVLMVIFLILLLAASVYSLVNFKNLKSQHYQLTNTIQSLKADLAEREDQINKLSEKIDSQKSLILTVGRQDTAAVLPGSTNGEIRIESLKVEIAEQGLSLNLRLVNLSQNEKLLSGYLMIIVEHQSGEYDKFGTFPEFALASGQPIDYLEGDTYAIRNYKWVTARIPLTKEPEEYQTMKFLVFSDEGEILLYDKRALQW